MNKKLIRNLIIFMIGSVLVFNYLYLFNVDTEYAIKFGHLIYEGDIDDFDNYFHKDAAITYGNESITYLEARKYIMEYINSEDRLDLRGTYGFGYNNQFGLAIIDTAHINGGLDGAVEFTYIKKLFNIKILKFHLEPINYNSENIYPNQVFIREKIYPIFFGKN